MISFNKFGWWVHLLIVWLMEANVDVQRTTFVKNMLLNEPVFKDKNNKDNM